MIMPASDNAGKSTAILQKFNGFKKADGNHRIVTEEFINSSREIAYAIHDMFGVRMLPVYTRMHDDLDHINKMYAKKSTDYKYLDDMIVQLKKNGPYLTAQKIHLITISLELVKIFLTEIVEDTEENEVIMVHLKKAYDCTLKRFHNVIVREMVYLYIKFVPNRSDMFGTDAEYLANMNCIHMLIPNLRDTIKIVYELCETNNVSA